jgi:anti-sigma factor RsiW
MNAQTPISSRPACPPPSRLDAYFDHEVLQAERAGLEAHLATCPECRQALQHIATTSSLMKTIELPALSQMSQARLMNEMTKSAAVRDRWLMSVRLLTAVAAAVFLLATCLIAYQLHNSGSAHPIPLGGQPIVGAHPTPGSSQVFPTGGTNPARP